MSAEDFDCYEVLGVQRDASDDQIKKGYRKAALRWHPDKNPDDKEQAEAMFKKVAEAYQILSDPQQRAIYDQGGFQALRGGASGGGSGSRARRGGHPGGFHDMDAAFHIFQSFFGGRDPFADINDMFAGAGFAPMGGRAGRGGRGSMPARGHPFGGPSPFASMFADDPFFSADFGAGGGGGGVSFMSSSSTSSRGGGGGGVVSSSTTTTTRVVNGKRVTVTEKKVRRADGTVETTRTESEGGSGGAGGAGGRHGNRFPVLADDIFAGFGLGGGRRNSSMLGF